MFLPSARLGVVVLVLASAAMPAVQALAAAPAHVAAFGDIGRYETIAADALAAAGKGDIAGAQKRGTDLETAWDEAEDALKPTDPTRWRVIDKAIDRVLSKLRAAKPELREITAALRDLLATFDKGRAA